MAEQHSGCATDTSAPAAVLGDTRKMVITLSLVSALSGLLIVGTFQWTAPFIAANREAMIEAAIFSVVPGGTRKEAYGFTADGIELGLTNVTFGERFYTVYDESGGLKGIALETSAQGYQDIIRILYGYDPVKQVVTGITVLESKETPGLGDKIAKDPAFLKNFEALDAQVEPTTHEIIHDITVVKNGSKTNPWEIDGITGATVSSKAIGAMLDQGLRAALPRLRPHLDKLEAPAS